MGRDIILKPLKEFCVAFSIAWPLIFGLVTGAEQFGFTPSVTNKPFAYIFITIISLFIGFLAFSIERKKVMESRVIEPFKTGSKYIKACTDIHRDHSNVFILSKTPGLLLPTERDLCDERKQYFQLINQRLSQGNGEYSLKYIFDINGFKSVIEKYINEKDFEKIEVTRAMIILAISQKNLDLRYANTDPLTSIVIGSESVACISFRDENTIKVTEGVRLETPELVRVIKTQYDGLFNSAAKVNGAFLDTVISQIRKN
jgi:hypothetical protein